MPNPFDSSTMAAGYAAARPPVHPRVMELARPALTARGTFRRALDIGCGAGLSTRALLPFAREVIGLDPVESMLQWRQSIAPGAHFVAGAAEALPFGAGEFDLMAAAGSLNFVGLDRFFPEAIRVLTPTGTLLVYDYSHGRNFLTDDRLDGWFSTFLERYPPVDSQARRLNPEILRGIDARFEMREHQDFAVALPLTREFYVEYLLTSTNVAAAVRQGASLEAIRQWCAGSLASIWPDEAREVVFRGYFACLRPVRYGSIAS
jgi:SAM-dependent methyltransferase